MNDNLYIESYIASVSKRGLGVSGDYCTVNRGSGSTDFILSDGLGSGISANIAAISCASRLAELINQDIPLNRAAEKLVELMNRARTESIPYATFTIARILKNGQFTVVNFENPTPLMVNNSVVQPLELRHFTISQEIVSEANGILNPGDSLILTSDGVSQAGLGRLPGYGWGVEGLSTFVRDNLRSNSLKEIADLTMSETYKLSGDTHADDTTMAVLTARPAKLLNIISGPPLNKERDIPFTMKFIKSPGKKIIAGSSTADMVSRVSGRRLKDTKISISFTQPPQYFMEGIDLVTEGAVTLNQVYNILDEDPAAYDKDSCVSALALMLLEADQITFHMGMARNEGHTDITFKQLGVLPRRKIIPLICDKLAAMGKLVDVITQ